MTDTDIHLRPPGSWPRRPSDHRGSWIPTGRMIAARFTELRKRGV